MNILFIHQNFPGQFKHLVPELSKRNHNIVVWMVAHPHKLTRDENGVIPPPNLYQVSGSAHWANMSDVAIVVHRDFEDNQTQIITRKIREQGVYGQIGQCFFTFNPQTRVYEEKT